MILIIVASIPIVAGAIAGFVTYKIFRRQVEPDQSGFLPGGSEGYRRWKDSWIYSR